MRFPGGIGGPPHFVAMTTSLPRDACNAHCHVFGPRERFAYAADAPFVPHEDAPREALYALNDRLGLKRCIVVQSTCHGFDNRVTEHAVAGRPEDYRGIALLRPDVGDAELRRLDRAGMRGVRFNFIAHLGASTPADAVLALAARIEPLGWHLQVHGAPEIVLETLGDVWRRSPVPVVIDHIGRVDGAHGERGAQFQALLGLMDEPHVWVKVSGMDRVSRLGAPYADAQPLARRLVADYGERVLWGNDWPHPNPHGAAPEDDVLAGLIHQIAPDPATLRRLMVDNPARLYRFGGLT